MNGEKINEADVEILQQTIERKRRENNNLQRVESAENSRRIEVNQIVIRAYSRLIGAIGGTSCVNRR